MFPKSLVRGNFYHFFMHIIQIHIRRQRTERGDARWDQDCGVDDDDGTRRDHDENSNQMTEEDTLFLRTFGENVGSLLFPDFSLSHPCRK